MIHAAITLAWCALMWLIPWPWLCFLPAAFYVGREFAQAEYRYIEQYCGRKRANMPWWAPFTPKAWTVKGVFDCLLPGVVAVAMFITETFLRIW